jgi:hypothetical protein
LIESARRDARNDDEAFLARLYTALAELEPEEVLGFRDALATTLERANSFLLRGAAFVINAERSEDGFEQFRGWLVARGREVFERALEDPESLAELVPESPEFEALMEELLYLPVYVYEEQTGKEIELPESWQTGLLSGPAGEPLDAVEHELVFPKLWERSRSRH